MTEVLNKTVDSKNSILGILNVLKDQIVYDQELHPEDREGQIRLNWYMEQVNKLEQIVKNEPRFNHVELQRTIDEVYRRDNTITGVVIIKDWVKTENPNRGVIYFKIEKK